MITAPNSELFELSELPNYRADSTVLAPSSTITNVRPPLRSISSMSPSQPAVEPAAANSDEEESAQNSEERGGMAGVEAVQPQLRKRAALRFSRFGVTSSASGQS